MAHFTGELQELTANLKQPEFRVAGKLFWLLGMYFFGEYAFLGLFFDPIIEAILRFISRDRLFIPLLGQHPGLTALLRNRYQFYLELPVWSVINPFFRWIF